MRIQLFVLAASVGLSACTPKLVEKLPYYKLSIVQGTPFEAERVLALHTGMSRAQVQMEIGTPLLNPSFRQNRWDYIYEIVRGGKVKESYNLSIHFNGDVVSSIEGSALDYAREQMHNTQNQ